ncbi:death-on-curing protein [candidate division MSBL1 archaeon SCGC-AAA385M11]|nr:death-on-curing protein [candidate division MSBL1 archaeon SCGC-AAA385M11]
MMRYLSLPEILELHDRIIETTGGARGIRDIRALESAINQPRLTFDRTDLYPTIIAKAAALCFFLVMNHPFVDGNKRIGHAAMETFLILNGFEIEASIDEQEKIFLDLASGKLNREEFTSWLNKHVIHITSS